MRTSALIPKVYISCSPSAAERLQSIVRKWDSAIEATPIHTKDELNRIEINPSDRLVCFNTGLIIPGDILARFTLPSINFHAASPNFPGRDPHHWAIYQGAKTYGVTAHIMTEKVDAGPVIAVDWFEIKDGTAPQQLREQATEALFGLFQRMVPFACQTLHEQQWSGRVTRRSDALEMANLKDLDDKEKARRIAAFSGFMKQNNA